MDISEEFNKQVNGVFTVIDSNRVLSTVLGLFIALYASLAAPILPRALTKFFKSTWFRLVFMFIIAYIATKDPSVAIISAVALLVTLQTLHAQETTNTVLASVEQKITENFQNFAQVDGTEATKDYNENSQYELVPGQVNSANLSTSDDLITMKSEPTVCKQTVNDKTSLSTLDSDTVDLKNNEMPVIIPMVDQNDVSVKNVLVQNEVPVKNVPVQNNVPVLNKNQVQEMTKPASTKSVSFAKEVQEDNTNQDIDFETDIVDLILGFENVEFLSPPINNKSSNEIYSRKVISNTGGVSNKPCTTCGPITDVNNKKETFINADTVPITKKETFNNAELAPATCTDILSAVDGYEDNLYSSF